MRPETTKVARKVAALRHHATKLVSALPVFREQYRLESELRAKSAQLRKLEKEHAKLRKFRDNFRQLFGKSPVALTGEQQVTLMRWLQRSDALTERDLHALLGNLFAQREISLAEPVIEDDSLGFEFLRKFYHFQLLDYKVDESTSHETIAPLLEASKGSFLRGKVLTLFLQRAVTARANSKIESTIAQLDDDELREVSRGTIMGICRLLMACNRPEIAARLLARYVKPGRTDQTLYFLELLVELQRKIILPPSLGEFCNGLQPICGPAVLDCLIKTYQGGNDVDLRNFRRFIADPLLLVSSDPQNLMDVRFSPDQRARLLDRIRTSALNREPLSLIRLGDGESYPYPTPPIEGIDATIFQRDDSSHERHWWGSLPSPKVREDIKSRVRDAVARCDIVGLPSVYRVIRDLPVPDGQYGKNRSQRALMRVLGGIGTSIPIAGKILTEERCHRCAIDARFVFELAEISRSVVLVSCWRELQAQFRPRTVETILTPPQNNLAARAASGRMPPLYEIYDEIIDQVRTKAGPGVLVLVGAGLIGKILVGEARDRGAVALDVGSLLDYMVGLKTRSVAEAV